MANRLVPRRARVALPAAPFVFVIAALMVACGAPAPTSTPAPAPTPTSVPTAPGATPAPTDLPAGPPPGPAAFADAPTGCLGLDRGSCDQVKAAVAGLVGDRPALYVEIGPFGCALAAPCPRTLEARPTGDVLVETADGAPPLGATVGWDGTKLEVAVAQSAPIILPPQSGPVPGGQVAVELGHCGLFTGIDLDGAWWDPVGFVDIDHPDAFNAAKAVIAATDADHAALRTAGGLAVQLVRRAGPKALRPCF
jgi:hypothetical protein